MNRTTRVLLNLFIGIPLFGPLIGHKLSDHRRILGEFVTMLVWSTFPFWFGSFIALASAKHSNYDYLSLLVLSASNGELLVFSASLLGPFFYMALHDPEGSKEFPGRPSHATFVALILAICAGLFGLMRSGGEVDTHLILTASYWLAGFALVLRYLATLYHSARLPNPPDRMKESETIFAAQVQERRG